MGTIRTIEKEQQSTKQIIISKGIEVALAKEIGADLTIITKRN